MPRTEMIRGAGITELLCPASGSQQTEIADHKGETRVFDAEDGTLFVVLYCISFWFASWLMKSLRHLGPVSRTPCCLAGRLGRSRFE